MGDSIVLKADVRGQLTSRWDPLWDIYRIRGKAVWIRQQSSGQEKTVNREKVRLVDPTIAWDDCEPRPRTVPGGRGYEQRRAHIPPRVEPPPAAPAGDEREPRRTLIRTKRRRVRSPSPPGGEDDSEPQPMEIETPPASISRYGRILRPSVRAREAASPEQAIDIDPVLPRYRKRRIDAPDTRAQKLARCDALYCAWVFTQ